MNRLQTNLIPVRNAWLHDIFIWSGTVSAVDAKRTGYPLMYGNPKLSGFKILATRVSDAIVYRKFDYKTLREIDSTLDNFSLLSFLPALPSDSLECKDANGNNLSPVRKQSTSLANFIASFCQEKNLYWDDSATSTYELDQIKSTMIGSALVKYGCLSSQHVNDSVSTSSTSNSTSANVNSTVSQSKTSTPKAPGQPATANYHTSGPHSQDIPNLIGTPGQKINLNNPVFCIEADKVGKNTPCAFITPLKVGSNNTIITVPLSQAEKVCFGSGHGWTDCALWFDNQTDANNALAFCQMNSTFSKYTNFHVAQAKKVDGNGYFKVSTQLGNAYIKAKTLNEDLDIALEQVKNKNKSDTVMQINLDNVELYENALYREI